MISAQKSLFQAMIRGPFVQVWLLSYYSGDLTAWVMHVHILISRRKQDTIWRVQKWCPLLFPVLCRDSAFKRVIRKIKHNDPIIRRGYQKCVPQMNKLSRMLIQKAQFRIKMSAFAYSELRLRIIKYNWCLFSTV